MDVPVGLKPLESGTPITGRRDTDGMNTMTKREGPLPCTYPCFNSPLRGIFQRPAVPGQGAADATELSRNRSALAAGDSCAYIF